MAGSAFTGQRVWAVVVVAALLAAGAAVFWSMGADDVRTEGERAAGAGAAPVGEAPPGPVEDYLAYVERLSSSQVVDVDDVVEGLRKLAGALGAAAAVGPDVAVDLRVAAEHILLNPESTGTTETVRNSLLAVAESVDGGRPDVELRQAAEAIDPAQPVIAQPDRVIEFFVGAAASLRRAEASGA